MKHSERDAHVVVSRDDPVAGFAPRSPESVAPRRPAAVRWAADVRVRPVSPADGDRIQRLVRALSLESRRARFFSAIRELSRAQLERMTHMAFPATVALVAESRGPAKSDILAIAQYACDEEGPEFAVVVADSWQQCGIGGRLVRQLVALASVAGFSVLHGTVLASNTTMLALAKSLGFTLAADRDPTLVRVVKRLARARSG